MKTEGETMVKEMKVSALTKDTYSNTPIVIHKEENGEATLPIWIGIMEATAIATELEKIEFQRPMTHDLLKNVISHAGGVVNKIEICDLKDNTFYAIIFIEMDGKVLEVDARPSDAIALALRENAAIFVNERVLEKSHDMEEHRDDESEEAKKWREILEGLDPKDFGKYKM